jgi:DNA polymerase-3 subunit delta
LSIISSAAADAFIKRLPPDLIFFLVHGGDEGLAHERVKGIVAAALEGETDPLRLVRFDGDALAREPGALADEAYAIAMFGGRRAIWIDAQGRDPLPALEPLFARPPQDCVIVVKAGILKKGTALRNAFEKRTDGASIECYADEERSLGPLIDAEARAAGLTIAPDARLYHTALLGADRQTTRGEIAKLMLYAHDKGRIEVEDVEAIVADAAPSGLDDLVDAALIGDMSGVEAAAARFFREGGDSDLLMIRVIGRALLIYRLRLEMEQGRSFDMAAQALFVRLPPASRAALAKQAERWSSATLTRVLQPLRAASARVRAEPKLSDALATRALWALAQRARGGRE